VVWTTKVTNNI